MLSWGTDMLTAWKTPLSVFVSFLATVMLAISCGGGTPPGELPLTVDRFAEIFAREIVNSSPGQRLRGELSSSSAVQIGITISTLNDIPPAGLEQISKYEIDFGDGGGWVDVTQEARNWDFGEIGRDLDVNRMTRRIYSEPGEYLIRGRVTYWDGEVYDTSGDPVYPHTNSNLLLRILSPEGAAE